MKIIGGLSLLALGAFSTFMLFVTSNYLFVLAIIISFLLSGLYFGSIVDSDKCMVLDVRELPDNTYTVLGNIGDTHILRCVNEKGCVVKYATENLLYGMLMPDDCRVGTSFRKIGKMLVP
ncbi:MAG: hypothetical protein HGA36_01990 [Candidatus Moranbacteria bacterium]|nr:hypothetical protein [Candidatus Moranbacteria bacterium]